MMNTLILLAATISVVFSEPPPPFKSKPFRPSQADPIIFQKQSPIPAKQYGIPEPVYGIPNNPGKNIEFTTPPNRILDSPRKLQAIVPTLKQFNGQQFDKIYQQQLPGTQKSIFTPKQKIQQLTSPFQGQVLPNPIRTQTFDMKQSSAQLFQVPHGVQQSPPKNFEIQKSHQFALKETNPTGFFPINSNINKQNSIDFHTASLINFNTAPEQTTRKIQKLQQERSDAERVVFQHGNQFFNEGLRSGKRASSSKRGGKTTSAPSRQYLTPEPTTSAPVNPPMKRRPSTVEPSEIETKSVARGPNVSISNSFAGRLFLLQPDGRLDPVILMRVNPSIQNISSRNIIGPSELLQSFVSQNQHQS